MRGTPLRTAQPRRRAGIIPAHAGNTSRLMVGGWSSGDHPRTCGEHFTFHFHKCCCRGSSPHMRGTPYVAHSFTAKARIIPAHAGNTSATDACTPYSRDHPRTCGEHDIYTYEESRARGSSPHMRGTLFCTQRWAVGVGDHPRTCGEHQVGQRGRRRHRGSSPHMRGTHSSSQDTNLERGIIPAHAGNTYYKTRKNYLLRDHPRTCGEHSQNPNPAQRMTGSSPHMRGTHAALMFDADCAGIIPAHAGNTSHDKSFQKIFKDHPRTCGEHRSRCRFSLPLQGSSPHMRGTLWLWLTGFFLPGIIPAHAGNTAYSTVTFLPYQDHPRTCGEHFASLHEILGGEGSSPHMRGTQRFTKDDIEQFGIIPAHAGNTEFAYRQYYSRRDHPRTCGEHLSRDPRKRVTRGSSPHMRGTLCL